MPIVVGVSSLRRCGKCGSRKPLACFAKHPAGRQWWCKECFRTYFAERGQLHREQTKQARRQRRINARELVNGVFEAGCADCGERDPLVLEFDHLGSKNGHVSEMVQIGVSLKRIREELAGCEVVCVNCHRRRTYKRAGDSWRLRPERLETSRSLARGERRNLVYLRDLLMISACCDCGTNELVLLEFDHRADKVGNVTQMAREGCSLENLKAEVAKCEVRCATCHRRRTIRELRAGTRKLVAPP